MRILCHCQIFLPTFNAMQPKWSQGTNRSKWNMAIPVPGGTPIDSDLLTTRLREKEREAIRRQDGSKKHKRRRRRNRQGQLITVRWKDKMAADHQMIRVLTTRIIRRSASIWHLWDMFVKIKIKKISCGTNIINAVPTFNQQRSHNSCTIFLSCQWSSPRAHPGGFGCMFMWLPVSVQLLCPISQSPVCNTTVNTHYAKFYIPEFTVCDVWIL